jgi:hypothetical protein
VNEKNLYSYPSYWMRYESDKWVNDIIDIPMLDAYNKESTYGWKVWKWDEAGNIDLAY